MAGILNVKKVCWLLFSAILLATDLSGERITEKIYQRIDDGFSCFRRLNGTHQIGCSSSQSGNVGVVHYVGKKLDFDWLLEVGPDAPYVVLLAPDLFRRENLMSLKNSGKVAGIVVLNQTDTTFHNPSPAPPYSNDLTCPNKMTGLYKNDEFSSYCDSNPWNPAGDAILFEDFQFPIFFINETKLNQSVLLDDCYLKFNRPIEGTPPSYPLCAIELKAFMWAAVDTPTCLRRGRLNMLLNPQPSEYCDPLGNVNIFVPVLAANKSSGPVRNHSVIFISAKVDSASIFDGLSVGADTAITGMATLIAIADMINKFKFDIRREEIENIFLVLFNGEAFDYIGSSRMAYEMTLGKFPKPLKEENPSQSPLIGLEHIKYWIELGSLAPHGDKKIYLHTDPKSRSDIRVDSNVMNLINALMNNQGNLTVESVNASIPLPPASLQSFLKKDLSIPGLLISNHKNAFTNQFYNNEWDTFQTISSSKLSKHLAEVAQTVSAAIYKLATRDEMPTNIVANVTLLESILECYLVNANCSLFSWLLNGRNNLATGSILPTYVGVTHGDGAYKALSLRTRHLLAMVSGDPLDINKTACINSDHNEIYHYYWMGEYESNNSSGTCYRSTVKTSYAVSPAFEIEDYDWASGEYSSWTESRWETFSVRIFLKASSLQAVSIFVFGVVVLLLSFAVTYWVETNSALLFPPSPEAVAC